MKSSLPAIRLLSGLIALWLSSDALAYVVTISPGARAVYLRVGTGANNTYNSSGGTPGNNPTINVVSVTVPAAMVGNGVNQAMTSNSNQGTSSLDGFDFCNVPAEIYIGGFYRRNGSTGTATLTATVPPNLTSAGIDTIPFSQISWTSSGNGDTGAQPIPAGTFAGGTTQTLASFPVNTWRESCHQFVYGNDNIVAAGTFTGRVIYTLSAP